MVNRKVIIESGVDSSFNGLLDEFAQGTKKIKVYRQMKMYNDESLNPILYKKG